MFLLKACVDEFSEVVFKRLENRRYFARTYCLGQKVGSYGRVKSYVYISCIMFSCSLKGLELQLAVNCLHGMAHAYT